MMKVSEHLDHSDMHKSTSVIADEDNRTDISAFVALLISQQPVQPTPLTAGPAPDLSSESFSSTSDGATFSSMTTQDAGNSTSSTVNILSQYFNPDEKTGIQNVATPLLKTPALSTHSPVQNKSPHDSKAPAEENPNSETLLPSKYSADFKHPDSQKDEAQIKNSDDEIILNKNIGFNEISEASNNAIPDIKNSPAIPDAPAAALLSAIGNSVQTIIQQHNALQADSVQHEITETYSGSHEYQPTETQVTVLPHLTDQNGIHQAWLQIHPPMLGKILASFRIIGKTAEVVLESDNKATHALLEADASSLRHALTVADIQVTHLRIEQHTSTIKTETTSAESGTNSHADKDTPHRNQESSTAQERSASPFSGAASKVKTAPNKKGVIDLWV